MIRVLLVDDHTVVRQGVSRMIELNPSLVLAGEAASGTEARAMLLDRPVDLLVTDLDMPGGGLSFVTEAHGLRPNLRILVLSQHSEREFALRALSAGAHGYVNKQASAEVLTDAMLRVGSGRRFLTEEAQELALGQLGVPDPSAPPHTRLTLRELEVLRHLARGRRVGEVATELGLSIKTVSTHRARILEKLGVSNTVDLALYAREHDLI